MKSLLCTLLFLFSGFLFASNFDDDVGSKEVTTIQAETENYQQFINKGFDLVCYDIRSVTDGEFLVVKYQDDQTEFVYCSLIMPELNIMSKAQRHTAVANIFKTPPNEGNTQKSCSMLRIKPIPDQLE